MLVSQGYMNKHVHGAHVGLFCIKISFLISFDLK